MHLPDLDWFLDHVVVPSDIERRPVGPVRAWQGWWAAAAHRLSGEVDGSPLGAATGIGVAPRLRADPRAGPRLRCL